MIYHHTQTATVTRVATVAGVIVAGYLLSRIDPRPLLWLLLTLAVLGVLAFSSLTVELDQERLRFWFGPGFLGRSFPFKEINAWASVKNPWWYGWGIHLTPRGWLYNVGGFDAVELKLTDGRRLRIGTDEPERLCEAIAMMKGAA